MDVPCPESNSTVLQMVPLACEEVPYRRARRSYLRRILVKIGGPKVLVRTSTTKKTSQTTLNAQKEGVGTHRISGNTSAHSLSSKALIVQIPLATPASRSLLAARRQNRVAGRTFRAES